MDKIAVIYWSGTGNTEQMAKAITDGIKSNGANVDLFFVSDISAEKAATYDKLVLGCPSMGDEVLEEGEFEPFFSELEGKIKDKKVALFGSYGWGDGQWMRDWEDRIKASGAILYKEGLIINEAPDDEGITNCNNFGKEFASY
ncbi:flavodoxin [Defluviitalea phaphyphila]|uniref:flavodoxin n=1 Tax=Defluviitalea phaphyphila TaxID=1473580 RepID=UPI0007314706|nr:flavodoxin [Defluviitalea phaphyphila]